MDNSWRDWGLDGDSPWPDWIEGLRPAQERAIDEIVSAYESGVKCVWVDAPTGAGKTVIGEAVRRRLEARRTAYVCSSITLQDQFAHDFPYAKVLKGRSNYPTLQRELWPKVTAAQCTKMGRPPWCMWCGDEVGSCPYEMAKHEALAARLSVLNTTYLLTEANYVGRMSKLDFVIADECDLLEDELMRFVEFEVSGYRMNKLKIQPPIKAARQKTLVDWFTNVLAPAAERARDKYGADAPSDPDAVKDLQQLNSIVDKAKWMSEQIASENWIRDYDRGPASFKPIKVDAYGQDFLWKHAKNWLCMSATIISPEVMAESLGWREDEDFAVVHVPMSFDVENRRVHVAPVANMVAKEKDQAWPQMAEAVANVLDRHRDERVLIHCVSYALGGYLAGELEQVDTGRTIIHYRRATEREPALAKFRATRGSVLIASSMERGVDLKDDECRVVVVAKVPFPSLGDKQTAARLHADGGQAWYSVQTIRSLVQMTGRGVRSESDWCVSYILDRQFVTNVWQKNKGLLPSWWKEALNMRFPSRELTNRKAVTSGTN